MPLPKDPVKAEIARKRMSEAAKKRMTNPEIREKIRNANIGKTQPPEVTDKIRAANMGKKRSPEFCRQVSERTKGHKISEDTRRKLIESHIGKKQSQETIAKRVAKNKGQKRSHRIVKTCAFCGKELVLAEWEKNRIFCSKECRGKWQSENAIGERSANWRGGNVLKKCEECEKEFSIEKNRKETARFCSQRCKGIWLAKNDLLPKLPVMTGENHPQWTGGPKNYCEKWTLEFRRRIRAFFDHKCAECGTPQNEKKLHCHHVYYDKKACCSVNENGKYFSNLGIKHNPHTFEIIGDPNKFIALCDSCHAKSSGKKNREYWARHFEEIINNYYLGKSYFTKEEFEKLK